MLKTFIWQRPYKAVRGKLRPWAPPLTQSPTLTAGPGWATPVSMQGTSRASLDGVASAFKPGRGRWHEVTEAELDAVVLRLRAQNTVPDPDGVPGHALPACICLVLA